MPVSCIGRCRYPPSCHDNRKTTKKFQKQTTKSKTRAEHSFENKPPHNIILISLLGGWANLTYSVKHLLSTHTASKMTTVLGDGTNRKTQDQYQNNLVAQSDYQKALNGFRDYFRKEQEQQSEDAENVMMHTGEEKVVENHSRNDANIEKAPPTTTLLQRNNLLNACQLSLEQNFTRMVQPVPDEEFHSMMDQYYPPEFDATRDAEIMEQELKKELEEEPEEEEYEEEDLLDPKALEQAQELREKVRQMSQRVEKLRNKVLLRASVITGNSSVLNQEILTSDSRPVLPEVSSHHHHCEADSTTTSSELYTSMSNLAKLLNHPNLAEIPHKMMVLQETMEVIQRDTSPTKTLSQTESAILSRTNDKENEHDARQRDLLTPPSPGDETPQDRLAHFLSRVSV